MSRSDPERMHKCEPENLCDARDQSRARKEADGWIRVGVTGKPLPHGRGSVCTGRGFDHAEHRLLGYALACGAAVAGAAPADAAVVYTDLIPDATIDGGVFDLDLDLDRTVDFELTHPGTVTAYSHPYAVGQIRTITPTYGGIAYNSILGFPLHPVGSFAAKLPAGHTIGPVPAASRSWLWQGKIVGTSSGYGYSGYFWGNTEGFLGLRFGISGATHYGWARLRIEPGGAIVLDDFAYASQADTPILAGEVPEPNSLGILALGAAGVAAMRSRRRRA